MVTEHRRQFLCTPRARQILRHVILLTRARWPFEGVAWVLLPDHLHTIWRVPSHDPELWRRWAYIKKEFTKRWPEAGGIEQGRSASRQRNRRRGVWQRRFWEHMVRSQEEFERPCGYVHYNPVKHELAACAHAWPYSTFSEFVEQGFYPADWCCACQRVRMVQNTTRITEMEPLTGE